MLPGGENGAGNCLIFYLLGHGSSKTTVIYQSDPVRPGQSDQSAGPYSFYQQLRGDDEIVPG